MELEIRTKDLNIIKWLIGNSITTSDSETIVPGNAIMQYKRRKSTKGMLADIPEIFEFTVTFLSGAVSSVIANWLYDKLKDNGVKVIRINHKQIEIEGRDSFQKIIETSVETES